MDANDVSPVTSSESPFGIMTLGETEEKQGQQNELLHGGLAFTGTTS